MNVSFVEEKRIGSTAFTLVELLAVIAIVVIIEAAILLPALNNAHQRAMSIGAINNVRQLVTGWKMYSGDNAGYLPQNRTAEGHPTWCAGQMRANQNGIAPSINLAPYIGVEDYTNSALLMDASFSQLGSFVRNPKVYLDPGDQSTWKDPGGVRYARVRSFSMNCAVGADIKDDGSSLGPFGTWRYYQKASDLIAPNPSDLWVFNDEYPDTINDGYFTFVMPVNANLTTWVDVPGAYHNGAGAFAFADGHAEMHRWQLPGFFPVVNWNVEQTPFPIRSQSSNIGNNPDILWFAMHTTALSPSAPPNTYYP
ncbi:MAG TPA: type II secretion system protein [Verrucomicrobiae bacterium]|nr:type II secretion system protein [Verrucomicrobiae bacterium]